MVEVWYGRGMVWYGRVWYDMVWHGRVWYGRVWIGMKLTKMAVLKLVQCFKFCTKHIAISNKFLTPGKNGACTS